MLVDRPWPTLASAHGHCGHLPDALAGLGDPAADVREAARWRIDNHVVLQRDLYEGAPWVVKALVGELLTDAHPGRALIYDLLWEFALGDAPGRVVRVGHEDVGLVALTRTEIRRGQSTYLRDTAHPEPGVAALASELVAEVASWGDQDR
jgi:hypothetical protein